jgi:hypothetical protein
MVEAETMVKDDAVSDWTARIAASFAFAVLALFGGVWWFSQANYDTTPATVVATSCSQFGTDALKLFDKGNNATLRGTFAPGDHVHLAIDLNGVGYSWELDGVLVKTKKVNVTGSGVFAEYTRATSTKVTTSTTSGTTTSAHGSVNGYARLNVDIDVIAAGDGAITFNKALLALTPPKVVGASCEASPRPTAKSGSKRSIS